MSHVEELGITALLADALLEGLETVLRNANESRSGKEFPSLPVLFKYTDGLSSEAPALTKRFYRLKPCRDGADPGGIGPADVRIFCDIIRKHGGDAGHAIKIETLFDTRYRWARPVIALGGISAATHQREVAKHVEKAGHSLVALKDADFRQSLLKDHIHNWMVRGQAEKALIGLGTFLGASESAKDHLGLGKAWLDFRGDVLVVAAHTFYRLGYVHKEAQVARKMHRLWQHTKNSRLETNWHAHRHLRNIHGDGSFRALELQPATGREVGAGLGRLYVYAVETCLHSGMPLAGVSSHLRMPLREALIDAYEMAKAAGDYDAALRFRTVAVRGHLWSNRWDLALREAGEIWKEIGQAGLNLPHAAMRLSFEEYVAHSMQAADGVPSASDVAQSALQRALFFKQQAGNAPILTNSHRREYAWLANNFNLGGLEFGD